METKYPNIILVKPHLQLITFDGMEGYTLSNIREYLSLQQFTQFQTWIAGQTVGMLNNEPVIYTHDMEQFLAGLPPLD